MSEEWTNGHCSAANSAKHGAKTTVNGVSFATNLVARNDRRLLS